MGERNDEVTVRFSEPGYYRAKFVHQEFAGWASIWVSWRTSANESYAPIDPRLLYAAHPGLPVGVSVVTGGVSAVAACDAGAVSADARLSGLNTSPMRVCPDCALPFDQRLWYLKAPFFLSIDR